MSIFIILELIKYYNLKGIKKIVKTIPKEKS